MGTVVAHAAGGFVLDRSIFHAPDARYLHKDPCDRGHVVAEGHKAKVVRVVWRDGALIHVPSSAPPRVGVRVQMHVDDARRSLAQRAHAAMHVLVAALLDERATLAGVPEVQGGGQIRVEARLGPDAVGVARRVLARANAALAAGGAVESSWAPRDEAARRITHHPVELGAIAPKEPTLRLTRIAGVTLPCTAPLVARVEHVGRLVDAGLAARADGSVRWSVRVAESEKK